MPAPSLVIVVMSEAKGLLTFTLNKKQVVRFAQDDKANGWQSYHSAHYCLGLLRVLERITARLIAGHKSGVVFEQVIQVLGIRGERLVGIWICFHVSEGQRVYGIAAVGVEIHVFFVSVGGEKIITHPAVRQRGQ